MGTDYGMCDCGLERAALEVDRHLVACTRWAKELTTWLRARAPDDIDFGPEAVDILAKRDVGSITWGKPLDMDAGKAQLQGGVGFSISDGDVWVVFGTACASPADARLRDFTRVHAAQLRAAEMTALAGLLRERLRTHPRPRGEDRVD